MGLADIVARAELADTAVEVERALADTVFEAELADTADEEKLKQVILLLEKLLDLACSLVVVDELVVWVLAYLHHHQDS